MGCRGLLTLGLGLRFYGVLCFAHLAPLSASTSKPRYRFRKPKQFSSFRFSTSPLPFEAGPLQLQSEPASPSKRALGLWVLQFPGLPRRPRTRQQRAIPVTRGPDSRVTQSLVAYPAAASFQRAGMARGRAAMPWSLAAAATRILTPSLSLGSRIGCGLGAPRPPK